MELAKVAELTEQLHSDGYTVTASKQADDLGIDLIARKGTEVIGYEVKSARGPALAPEVLSRLQAALRQGTLTELRLVTVESASSTPTAEVIGIEDALSHWLSEHNVPELDELSSETRVDSVEDVELVSLLAYPDRLQAEGTGTLTVELNFDGGAERDGMSSKVGLPLAFEADLTPSTDGKHFVVQDLKRREIDTSVLYNDG
jgi:hypothetical protein